MVSNNPLEAEKDLPLRDDIRLLGRILGDTVREQEGETIFDIVERIRPLVGNEPLSARDARRVTQQVEELVRMLGFE